MGVPPKELLLLFSEEFVRIPHTKLSDQQPRGCSVTSKESILAVAAAR
jgi:hypothetical protein